VRDPRTQRIVVIGTFCGDISLACPTLAYHDSRGRNVGELDAARVGVGGRVQDRNGDVLAFGYRRHRIGFKVDRED
jgi:hypothetical protein